MTGKRYVFAADISAFVKKTKIKQERVIRVLAQRTWIALFQRSPVDTGRFRASWRISIDAPDLSMEPFREKNKESRARAQAEATAVLDAGLAKAFAAKMGMEIWFSNSIPYATDLESGTSQRQAPQGVLKVSFEEMKGQFDIIVKSIK